MTQKYTKPEPVPLKKRTWIDACPEKAPVWCAVDLRDGNQALPEPMNPDHKLRYFHLLADCGFREMEVAFPSASKSEFDFVRKLITGGHVPEDVCISVLSPVRESLIRRTVLSLAGVRQAIFHLYLATSELHSRIVLGKDRKELRRMAVAGTRLVRNALKENGLQGKIRFEFSPEEFTDTDPEFSVEICSAVREAWEEPEKDSFIVNLPATVERRPPWQYADLIQYFRDEFPYTEKSVLSIHSHNDQGCAIAASEMALLAGAERVEGTLFGYGERTGNTDLAVLALNLLAMGVDPGLDFSDLPRVVHEVEDITGITIHERHPYAGSLVFTAFSGSHQDAVHKGLEHRKEAGDLFHVGWKVPYLHIDPTDIGRNYENIIRINSQSGKGGIVYVLEHDYGIYPPKGMYGALQSAVKACSEKSGGEVRPPELLAIFKKEFLDVKGPMELLKFSPVPRNSEAEDSAGVTLRIQLKFRGVFREVSASGNGPISAAVHALRDEANLFQFVLEDYSERSLGLNADAAAIAFVGIRRSSDHQLFYGVGEHPNIDQAAMHAIFSAVNKAMNDEAEGSVTK